MTRQRQTRLRCRQCRLGIALGVVLVHFQPPVRLDSYSEQSKNIKPCCRIQTMT